jgi:hypothetical protein
MRALSFAGAALAKAVSAMKRARQRRSRVDLGSIGEAQFKER